MHGAHDMPPSRQTVSYVHRRKVTYVVTECVYRGLNIASDIPILHQVSMAMQYAVLTRRIITTLKLKFYFCTLNQEP